MKVQVERVMATLAAGAIVIAAKILMDRYHWTDEEVSDALPRITDSVAYRMNLSARRLAKEIREAFCLCDDDDIETKAIAFVDRYRDIGVGIAVELASGGSAKPWENN